MRSSPARRRGGSAEDGRDARQAVRELFVIQNPAAGWRSPRRLARRIASALEAEGVVHEVAHTRGPGHAADLARVALEHGARRILVAGGDGTVLEVVSAIAGTEAALAVLPVGTGNQLAANLRVPRSLRAAIDVAIRGRLRSIDVGWIDGRPFTCMAGAGFDAEVVRPGWRAKRRLGYLAYLSAAARTILSPPRADLRVVIDGRETTCRGMGVEVANMPGLSAPGLRRPIRIVPRGRLDDGKLEVCILAFESRSDLMRALLSILLARADREPRLRYHRGREVRVEAQPALSVQADGEQFGTTPFTAVVEPGALSVVVPDGEPSEDARKGVGSSESG